MSSEYVKHVSPRETAQSDKARPEQVENSAGGFVFELDCWGRLDRWLILGAEGGTYYATEKKIVVAACKAVEECLAKDGPRTVARIAEISERGRAPKNDPAILALAMAAGSKDPATRTAALAALPRVCRIGTHLFHFVRDVGHFRRWGRSLTRAVSRWYTDRPVDSVALDAVKYQQRDGFSHRDVLRLAHPKAETPELAALFRWIATDSVMLGERSVARKLALPAAPGVIAGANLIKTYPALDASKLPRIVEGFERMKDFKRGPEFVARVIREYGLTHEMVPGEAKDSPLVWEALLEKMPMTAVVRNLAKMTAVGILSPMSAGAKRVTAALSDAQAIRKARLHPVALLLAQLVYAQGRGVKGKLSWTPSREVIDALDAAFYLTFEVVEPTGQNTLLAIDVSGSMDGGVIAGAPGLTPRIAAAAMAMVTARSEKNWHAVGFSSGAAGEWKYGEGRSKWSGAGRMFSSMASSGLTPLTISPKQRLEDVAQVMRRVPMGGTDCALPMLYAAANKIDVDAFVVYTDNETWAGNVHPFQALQAYRQVAGKPRAKLAVVGMTATEFTIADPSDAGMMDVVGFDAAAPALMADFFRGGK